MSLRNGKNRPSSRAARLSLERLEDRLALHADALHFDCLDPHHDHDHEHDHELHALPPMLQLPSGSTGGAGSDSGIAAGPLVVPAYSSRPTATATIFLDFDGHFESTWGSYGSITTPAYDTDGDASTFSASELSSIQQIWQAVSEDFAPFNVNVTTVAPASFANGVGLRVSIGGGGSWTGGTYGGIAYINSFTNSIVNTVYVFSDNLGGGYAKYVADASSHEAGHAFGLQHQSAYSGTTLTASYQSGPGDGTAPTMGNSYSAQRSMWWYGQTTSSTTYQNDMDVIANATNGFGYRVDDHGNAQSTATALTVSATGTFSTAGVIERMTDLDAFSFTTGAGSVTLTVDTPLFNNLDTVLELRDANWTLIASANPSSSFDATISATLAAGTYYVVVKSSGPSANSSSTNYGMNVGQYSLTGTVVVTSGESAPNAPSNLTAAAAGTSAINVSWVDNSTNETGFRIERLVGSTWTQVALVGANVTSWQDTGLTSGTSYSYRVRATNSVGDSAFSNTATATTQASVPNAPSNLTAAAAGTSAINVSWVDNSTNETGFRIERLVGSTWTQVALVGANVTSWQDTGLTSGTTYSYRVRATNAVGDSAFSNTAMATTQVQATAPNAPSNLAAVSASTSAINLSWVDNSTNETGFRIERLVGSTWTQVALVGANVTSWQNTGLASGTAYTYRVRATNAVGDSPDSNTATATTQVQATAPAAPTNLAGTVRTNSRLRVALTWRDNATNESGYRVYRSNDGGATWVRIASLRAGRTSFNDYGVSTGSSYRYRVEAWNSSGAASSDVITVNLASGGSLRRGSLAGDFSLFQQFYGSSAQGQTRNATPQEKGQSTTALDENLVNALVRAQATNSQ